VIEPNGIEPAKSCLSIWARSQHGIEARVLTARLFASMRQKSAFLQAHKAANSLPPVQPTLVVSAVVRATTLLVVGSELVESGDDLIGHQFQRPQRPGAD
jgi:hypothetical protein